MTKAVDEILTGQKSLDLSQENFPVLNKTEDNQIDEVKVAGEVWRRSLKNVSHSIVEPRSHRGHTLKEEDDKPKDPFFAGNPSPGDGCNKIQTKGITHPKKFEDFTKGSFDSLLVKDVRCLSIREEPQQDP